MRDFIESFVSSVDQNGFATEMNADNNADCEFPRRATITAGEKPQELGC